MRTAINGKHPLSRMLQQSARECRERAIVVGPRKVWLSSAVFFVEANVMISKINVTASVQAVQLVAPRARCARMIPAQRSEVFQRDMLEDWRNFGRSRLEKSKTLRARSPPSSPNRSCSRSGIMKHLVKISIPCGKSPAFCKN